MVDKTSSIHSGPIERSVKLLDDAPIPLREWTHSPEGMDPSGVEPESLPCKGSILAVELWALMLG